MPGNFDDYLEKVKNRRTQIEYSNSFDDEDIDEEDFNSDLDEDDDLD